MRRMIAASVARRIALKKMGSVSAATGLSLHHTHDELQRARRVAGQQVAQFAAVGAEKHLPGAQAEGVFQVAAGRLSARR